MPFASERKHGFYCPWGPRILWFFFRLLDRQAYSQGAEKSGKKIPKKREKSVEWKKFDQCSGVEFTFCNKSADTSEWFVPPPISAAEAGSERQTDLKKKLEEKKIKKK